MSPKYRRTLVAWNAVQPGLGALMVARKGLRARPAAAADGGEEDARVGELGDALRVHEDAARGVREDGTGRLVSMADFRDKNGVRALFSNDEPGVGLTLGKKGL